LPEAEPLGEEEDAVGVEGVLDAADGAEGVDVAAGVAVGVDIR
jgi:hypothetical protein